MEILSRARRLRTSEAVRELARETRISKTSLVYPMFVREGSGIKEEIPSLANQYHYSPDTICEGVKELVDAGVTKILLFGIPAHKDEIGSSAWQDSRFLARVSLTFFFTFPGNRFIGMAGRRRGSESDRRNQEKFPTDLLHHRRVYVRVYLPWPLRCAV